MELVAEPRREHWHEKTNCGRLEGTSVYRGSYHKYGLAREESDNLRPFFDKFKELGEKQTRVIKVARRGDFGALPPDEYAFVELYCDKKNCDCRRVMIMVLAIRQGKILATINLGFDSREYDAGPFLDPLNRQSEHSQDLMDLFLEVINTDPAYLASLQRHYVMFKESMDRKKYSGAPFETPGEVKRVENFPALPSLPRPRTADP